MADKSNIRLLGNAVGIVVRSSSGYEFTYTCDEIINAITAARAALPGAQDTVSSSANTYGGLTRAGIAGTTLAFGDLVYLDPTDSRWELADANEAAGANGDARGILGICVLAASADGDPTTILLSGTVRAATFPALTVNAPAYVGETAGDIVVAQPVTADVVIRRVGFGLSTNELLFCPEASYLTHA
jgi:hypothetical protein